MNNADNHAAIEVKRKIAVEESRYEMAERGEPSKRTRDFEKPDKPDDAGVQQHEADSLTSLPPADLRNVALLMVLCTSAFSYVVDKIYYRGCRLGWLLDRCRFC
jgi:hypothetical protein